MTAADEENEPQHGQAGEHQEDGSQARLSRRDFLRSKLRPDLDAWHQLALASLGAFLSEVEPVDPDPREGPLRLAYQGSLPHVIFAGESSVVLPPAVAHMAVTELGPEHTIHPLAAAVDEEDVDVWCGPMAAGLELIAGNDLGVSWVAGLTVQRAARVTAAGTQPATADPAAAAAAPQPLITRRQDQLAWVARLYRRQKVPAGSRVLWGPELALALASGRVDAQALTIPEPGLLAYGLFCRRAMTRGTRHRLLLALVEATARRCRQLAAAPGSYLDALAYLLPDAAARLASLAGSARDACLQQTAPSYVPAPLLAETVAAELAKHQPVSDAGSEAAGQPSAADLRQAVYTGAEA